MFRFLKRCSRAASWLVFSALVVQVHGKEPALASPHSIVAENGAHLAGDAKNPLEIAWHQNISLPEELWHAVLGKDSLILDGRNFVLCLQREGGRTLWRANLNVELPVAPVQCGPLWVVALENGQLEGVDSVTGQTIWTKEFPAPIMSLAGEANHVVVVGRDSSIWMIESATGDIQWQKETAGSASIPPVLAGDGLCIVARKGGVVACTDHVGNESWSRQLDSNSVVCLAAEGDEVFAITWDHTVWSLDARTGEVRWKRGSGRSMPIPPVSVEIAAVGSNHLFIQAFGGSLFVLSRATGDLRFIGELGGTLSIHPLVQPDQVIFVTPHGYGSLMPFDTQSEVLFDRVPLPANNTIIATEGPHALLRWADGGLALARLHFQSASPYQEHFPGNAKLWLGMAMTAAIVGALLAGAVTFAATGRPRIPSTQITSLLLFALLAGVGTLCVVTGRMGWLILCHDPPRSWVAVGMAAALFTPVFCLCVVHLALWWQGHLPGKRKGNPSNNPESMAVIRRLAGDMELPADTVQRTVEATDGPFVSGASSRQFNLFLPRDLDQRALRACRGDRSLTAGLLRLVLAHELAHVRNGDVIFLPLLIAARQILPWCFAVILVGSLLVDAFGPSVLVAQLAWGMAGIVTVGGIAGWVLLTLALRERERLADATATLFVSPDTIKRLTETKPGDATSLSPLAAFLAGLKIRSIHRMHILGFGANTTADSPGWWQCWVQSFRDNTTPSEFEREVTGRSRDLVRKEHAVVEIFAKNWEAGVAAGIVAGLLLGAFAHFVAIDFYERLLQLRGAPTNPLITGFLKAYPLWTHEQAQSVGWNVARALAPLVSGMLLVGTALLPWRDIVRKVRSEGKEAVCGSLVVLFLSLIVAEIIFGMTAPDNFPFPSFPMLRVSAVALWFWSAVAALMFGGLLVVRPFLGHRMRQVLLESLGILALVMFGGALCWWFLEGLSVSGRLLWTLALILIPSVLLTAWPLRRFMTYVDYPDEGIRFIRVFGAARLFCNRLGGQPVYSRQFLAWLSGQAFVVFCLSALLLAVPLRNTMLKLDSARFEQARTDRIQMARLTEDAPDAIRADSGKFSRQFFPLLAELGLFNPTGPRPSTWLGLAALAFASLLGFCDSVVQVLLVPKKNRRVLANTGPLVELFETLGLPTVQRQFRPRLDAALKRIGSPAKDEIGVPLLHRTCRVVECADRLDLKYEQRQKMLEWVLACEGPRGGFGPERQVTLQHTAGALRMLQQLNVGLEFDRDLHERWLREVLAECWRKRATMPPSDWLTAVGLTVEGLERIEGALPKLTRLKRLGQGFVQASFHLWQASEQSTLDTRYLVAVLSVWKRSAHSISAKVQQAWLPTWESRLSSLHPETALRELADSVMLLSKLFPEVYKQRPSVVQLADNLEKSWQAVR